MSPLDLEKLTKELPKLTTQQLRDLDGQIAFLLKVKPDEETPEELLVFGCISDCLRGVVGQVQSFSQFKRSRGYRSFLKNLPTFSQFIDQQIKPTNRIERRKIILVLLRALIRIINRWEVPLSATTISQQLHKIAGFVDLAFPGYAASGYLPRLISAHQTTASIDK